MTNLDVIGLENLSQEEMIEMNGGGMGLVVLALILVGTLH
jgi:hypothetical protein